MSAFSAQGQLLISMPQLGDGFFADSVIAMCEHDDNGALGFALNKPSEFSLLTLFRDLDLPADPELGKVTAMLGGPVDTQRGFILSDQPIGDCKEPMPGLFVNAHTQHLTEYTQALIQGSALFVLGYSGWSKDQLVGEISENSWLTAPWRPELAFSIPVEQRHHAAIQGLGFDWHQLNSGIGHA